MADLLNDGINYSPSGAGETLPARANGTPWWSMPGEYSQAEPLYPWQEEQREFVQQHFTAFDESASPEKRAEARTFCQGMVERAYGGER